MKSKKWFIIIVVIIILIFGGILLFKIFSKKSLDDYVVEHVKDSKENLNTQFEKEDITLAIMLAMSGGNTFQTLTYENLNEQLSEKLGAGNYKLTGPDAEGNFTLKINAKTYIINSNGSIQE